MMNLTVTVYYHDGSHIQQVGSRTLEVAIGLLSVENWEDCRERIGYHYCGLIKSVSLMLPNVTLEVGSDKCSGDKKEERETAKLR